MQTALADFIKDTPEGKEADSILRKCVHCGFCTATCPTYQLLGDELDGPRGRIYLIKQVLEGHEVTAKTQLHLDRCLTCRNCETTCPSGVKYGRLVDIGRKIVDDHVPRPAGDRLARIALKEGVTSPLFGPAMRIGQMVRPLLPQTLQTKVPPRQRSGTLALGFSPTQSVAARRLRAALDGAEHQYLDGARARCPRHRDVTASGGRLLRRDSLSLERSRRWTRRCSTQYQCVVAVCPTRRGRWTRRQF